nr:hypothetical protein [Tanacetum cinerariifolium]
GENISWLKLAYTGDGFPIYRSCVTNSVPPTFIGRDASTLRLQGGAFYGTIDKACDGVFDKAFEEKGGLRGEGGFLRTQQSDCPYVHDPNAKIVNSGPLK